MIFKKEKYILVLFSLLIFFIKRGSNTQEGVGALWTGLGPNVARNAIINAAELASYDQVKQVMHKIPDACLLESNSTLFSHSYNFQHLIYSLHCRPF